MKEMFFHNKKNKANNYFASYLVNISSYFVKKSEDYNTKKGK